MADGGPPTSVAGEPGEKESRLIFDRWIMLKAERI